ncbi:MAG TPA: hypothetical protein VN132_08675 [Bdellovibrio sp.]|nr:hypothetical protein [Bdellovibrio sp.]
MIQHAWFEHFRDKLQGLTTAFEDSGTTMSLLGFALKEKYLSSEDYLKWAMSHYRLPFLQARFFSETPPSPDLFLKWATHYIWSPECLPVAEWDGALIVACLQPPQDFPSFPQCILVLAPWESLEQTWRTFLPAVEMAAGHSVSISSVAVTPPAAPTAKPSVEPKAVESPDGISPALMSAGGKKEEDLFSFDGIESSESESSSVDAPEGEEPEEVEMLEGLLESPQVTKLESLSTKSSPTSKVTAPPPAPPVSAPVVNGPPPPPANVAPPAEIPWNEGATMIAPSPLLKDLKGAKDSGISPAATLASLKPPVVAKKEDAPLPPPVVAVKEKTAPEEKPVAATKVPSEKEPSETPQAPKEDSFSGKSNLAIPRPLGAVKPTINQVAQGNFALEKFKKKNSSLVAERVKETLGEMKSHFDKSMILMLDDQETQAVAFAWDETFTNIKDTSQRVPLKTPSIFNIVAATTKPFHGYISLNDINEKFFEDWNEGRIPDHITITPIMIQDKVVGMLVGFAEKSAYNRATLSFTEKLSNNFLKDIAA